MTTLYDAGVLMAADRGSRTVWADHRARLEMGLVPVTTAPVVAQVSRSSRQAQLHRFVQGCEVVGFEPSHAAPVGTLLAAASTADVVDAHLIVVAVRLSAPMVVTSDLDDMSRLADHTSKSITIRTV